MANLSTPEPCPPLTEAQVALISSETERAASKALKRYRRPAVAGYLVLLLGLLGGFQQIEHQRTLRSHEAVKQRHTIVQSGKAVAVTSCNTEFHQAEALRGLLLSAQKLQRAAAAKGTITVEQQKQADQFYGEALTKVKEPDCREAKAILTDNPNAKIIVPKPLYPPSPLPNSAG